MKRILFNLEKGVHSGGQIIIDVVNDAEIIR